MNVKSPRGAVPYLLVNGLIRSPLTYQLTHKTYQKLVIKLKKKIHLSIFNIKFFSSLQNTTLF
jgi:hypothetical protein